MRLTSLPQPVASTKSAPIPRPAPLGHHQDVDRTLAGAVAAGSRRVGTGAGSGPARPGEQPVASSTRAGAACSALTQQPAAVPAPAEVRGHHQQADLPDRPVLEELAPDRADQPPGAPGTTNVVEVSTSSVSTSSGSCEVGRLLKQAQLQRQDLPHVRPGAPTRHLRPVPVRPRPDRGAGRGDARRSSAAPGRGARRRCGRGRRPAGRAGRRGRARRPAWCRRGTPAARRRRATPRTATAGLPMKPGSSRTTASTTTSTATSPPLST